MDRSSCMNYFFFTIGFSLIKKVKDTSGKKKKQRNLTNKIKIKNRRSFILIKMWIKIKNKNNILFLKWYIILFTIYSIHITTIGDSDNIFSK